MSVCISTHRISPNNIIARLVKHDEAPPKGVDDKSQFIYSPHFTNKYYHPISSHITRKNLVLKGSVRVDRTTTIT